MISERDGKEPFGSIPYAIPNISLMKFDISFQRCVIGIASLRFSNIYTYTLHMETDPTFRSVAMSGMCLCLGFSCDWDVSMIVFYFGMGPCMGCARVWDALLVWGISMKKSRVSFESGMETIAELAPRF